MAVALHTPRINNNDDFVRVSHLYVEPGAQIRRGDPLADLETDKATFTVEAEQDGYLLAFCGQIGNSVAVGSILAWIGESAGEALPAEATPAAAVVPQAAGPPTVKAALLLAQHGLSAADVPASGARLTASDVEQFIASRPPDSAKAPAGPGTAPQPPTETGHTVELTAPERGMLHTVLWQQREAVAAYIEIAYDPRPWEEFAAAFQQRNRLLMSPLLSLLAWRLVRIAARYPGINATVAGERRYVYDHVNLGFTVQAGSTLYVVVARDAEHADALSFVNALSNLQRSAMRGALRPAEVSGATIGFSSMARWSSVSRHVPVLLPQTSLMVAHSAPQSGGAILGATYDHRILHGADIVRILQELQSPQAED